LTRSISTAVINPTKTKGVCDPLNQYHEPDLSFITGTTHAIAPHLQPGQLIVVESTTYPGTTEEVMESILEKENKLGLKAARGVSSGEKEFFVAFSPEREDPGNTTVARHDIPKVGGVNPQASGLAGALYGSIFRRTVPVSSPATAEMTKLLENIYRCVNIALVNELKLLCLRMGLDIWEVIESASTKPFGFHPFYSGPGWADTAFLSIPSIFRGRRRSGTSARALPNWRTRSIPRCLITFSLPLGER